MRRVALVLVVGAALLGGCGGSGNGGNKDTYVKAGDAICADYEAAIGKLGQPNTLGEIGPFITSALPVLKSTVARVEKLDPPSDLADEYAKFRDAARATLSRATALREAAAKADGTEVQRLLKEAAAATKARVALAHAAGLETCAKI